MDYWAMWKKHLGEKGLAQLARTLSGCAQVQGVRTGPQGQRAVWDYHRAVLEALQLPQDGLGPEPPEPSLAVEVVRIEPAREVGREEEVATWPTVPQDALEEALLLVREDLYRQMTLTRAEGYLLDQYMNELLYRLRIPGPSRFDAERAETWRRQQERVAGKSCRN